MRKPNSGNNLPQPSNHVVIQNGYDPIDHIETKSEAFDYLARQIQNILSLIPLFKEQCCAEEKREKIEKDVFFTVDEAAEFIKVSKPTIYDLINSNELPCYVYGQKKQKRIWRSDLIKLGTKKDQ